MKFFTSDLHLHSTKELLQNSDIHIKNQNYEELLIKRYNSVVGTNDTCYILGDIGTKISVEQLQEFLSKLNGKKIFLIGNHDMKEGKLLKAFDTVLYNAEIVIANELVSLSHYPLKNVFREDLNVIALEGSSMYDGWENDNWYKESIFGKFAVHDHGQFHLHGHTHCRKSKEESGQSKIQLGRQWDISIFGNNLTPISEKQVMKWIVKNR